jgi:hypothetical protein
MATSNIAITKTWTKLANAADTSLLVTFRGHGVLEVALTAADSAPTVVNGHLVGAQDALTRIVLGEGFVWARANPGGNVDNLLVEVSKS